MQSDAVASPPPEPRIGRLEVRVYVALGVCALALLVVPLAIGWGLLDLAAHAGADEHLARDAATHAHSWGGALGVAALGFALALVAGLFAVVGVRRAHLALCTSEERGRALAESLAGQVEERARELAASERACHGILQNLPGMVYRCRNDRQWKLSFCSEGASDLLGVTPHQLLAGEVTVRELVHPDDLPRLGAGFDGQLREGSSVTEEYRVIRPDGRQVWLRNSMRATRHADGGESWIDGLAMDITPFRRLQERQQAEAEVLAALRNGAPLAEALAILTRAVEAECPGVVCAVLLEDAAGERLVIAHTPGVLDRFGVMDRDVLVATDAGCCARAARAGARVVVEDCSRVTGPCALQALAGETGIRSGCRSRCAGRTAECTVRWRSTARAPVRRRRRSSTPSAGPQTS